MCSRRNRRAFVCCQVTIFKYHNRGTFLATVMGEEYGERCAGHRARGLTRSYFALTRRVC